MGYNCLPISPHKERVENFPTKYCWVEITKEYRKPEPEKGKKRVDSSKLKEYNEMIEKRTKMFKQLDTGYYNCFNNPIDGENITQEERNLFGDFNSYFYRVDPISSKTITPSSYYNNRKEYKMYEFNIIKKCETPDELLSQLYKDCDLVEFMREVFDNGRYGNEGYRDTCIKWFKYCKDKFEKFNMNLDDIVFAEYGSYERYARYKKDEKYVESLAIELIDAGYINLYDIYDYEVDTFKALIEMNWFILAKRYLDAASVESNYKDTINNIKKDKSFESVKYILKTNSDNEGIKYIIGKLDYTEPKVTLKVYEYYDDFGYSKENEHPVEVKDFKTIDEVRSYLISQYKVPFSTASGDITDFEYENEECEEYHFIVE